VHRWTNRNNVGSRGISAESKFFQVRRMCKLGGEASLIVRSKRTRKLVSGRAEDLVFKVMRREDAR
jgi:hypothetical protein